MPEEEKISISEDLMARIERRLEKSNFDSVDEYIQFTMNEVLNQIDSDDKQEASQTNEDQKVKARLESLGYLNE